MVKRNATFVNNVIASFVLSAFFFVPAILAEHTAIISFAPYPKEVYANTAILQNPATAVTGNIVFHNGKSYSGNELISITLAGNADIIKIVITDRLKPILYKLSTNEGFELDLTNNTESVKTQTEQQNNSNFPETQPAPQLLAKCFLLTKKDTDTNNFSWDIKITEVFADKPLPSDFSSNFLIPATKKGGSNNTQRAVFLNEVILFIEKAVNADLDIARPVPKTKEQGACQDAVLPSILVRTDVERCAVANVLTSFPFVEKMHQQTRSNSDKKNSTTIVTADPGTQAASTPPSTTTPPINTPLLI